VDAGADLLITADAQVLIDGLVTAPHDISITAGTVSSGYALIVLPTIMEGTPEQRVSGGEIRTAAGGSIELRATGGILLRGLIGSSTTNGGVEVADATTVSAGLNHRQRCHRKPPVLPR
jgi:hypothetical protein